MSNTFVSYVETVLCAELDDLTVGQLQAHALELRVVTGRLLGRADQVLAAVHARSGGQVLESSLLQVSGAVDGLGSTDLELDGEGGVSEASAAADAPAPSGVTGQVGLG